MEWMAIIQLTIHCRSMRKSYALTDMDPEAAPPA